MKVFQKEATNLQMRREWDLHRGSPNENESRIVLIRRWRKGQHLNNTKVSKGRFIKYIHTLLWWKIYKSRRGQFLFSNQLKSRKKSNHIPSPIPNPYLVMHYRCWRKPHKWKKPGLGKRYGKGKTKYRENRF